MASIPSSSSKPAQLPDAVIDGWDPEPVKVTVKEVYRVYNKAAGVAVAAGLDAAASAAYPALPNPVKNMAIAGMVQKGEEACQKLADKTVDALYSSPNSMGSRLVKWYRGNE